MLLQMVFYSFLWLSNSPLYICITSFSYLPFSEYFGYFHVLAIVDSTCMYLSKLNFFQIYAQ